MKNPLEKFKLKIPANIMGSVQAFARRLPEHLQRFSSGQLKGKNASFYGRAATIIVSTYLVSDIPALVLENYIPEAPPSHAVRYSGTQKRARTVDDYRDIYVRNLVNSKGLIPGEEEAAPDTIRDNGGAPVKSSLPFNLIGTLIMKNELRSIATIEDKAASAVYPVRINDEIPGKAKIVKVEPDRVIFVNTSSGRREYIELPLDQATSNARITLGGPKSTGPGIEKVSPTQYNLARSEVDKTLANINQVLTDARAIPNMENGVPAGYKLFQIVPGSIYDKLGLQNGDVLCGLNGESINDPGKAFELLSQLKTSSHLDLCVKRNGNQASYSYDIH